MTRFPLRNVLLNAVLASSTVFSALTLPVVLLKPQPIAIELPPFFEGEIQPMFGGENRNLAIPYIGFSIVMSVGAGMVSVEISRKGQAAQQQKQTWIDITQEVLPIQAIEAEAEYSLNHDYASFATSDHHLIEVAVEADSESIWSAALLEFSASNNISNNISNDVLTLGINRIQNNAPQLLQPYPTCPTHAPKLRRRLSGILSQGHSYRQLQAKRIKAKLPEAAMGLDQKIDRVMISETQRGQAVWVWEPNAYLSPDLSKVD